MSRPGVSPIFHLLRILVQSIFAPRSAGVRSFTAKLSLAGFQEFRALDEATDAGGARRTLPYHFGAAKKSHALLTCRIILIAARKSGKGPRSTLKGGNRSLTLFSKETPDVLAAMTAAALTIFCPERIGESVCVVGTGPRGQYLLKD